MAKSVRATLSGTCALTSSVVWSCAAGTFRQGDTSSRVASGLWPWRCGVGRGASALPVVSG
eukprot:364616-Chlamydomonas_euryale.AAC.5